MAKCDESITLAAKTRRPWLLSGGKPARVGRVQTQIRRAFIASGGRQLKIRDLIAY